MAATKSITPYISNNIWILKVNNVEVFASRDREEVRRLRRRLRLANITSSISKATTKMTAVVEAH